MEFQNKGFPVRGKLNIAEYVSIAGSIFGSLAAITSQQVVYAAAPLTIALSLALANRQRFEQQTQTAIADINEVVKSLDNQVKLLPNAQQVNNFEAATLNLSTKSLKLEQALQENKAELNTISQAFDHKALQTAITQIQQLQQRLDHISKLEIIPVEQLQTEMRSQQAQIEQQNQQDEDLDKKVEKLQLRFQIVSYLCSEMRELKLQQKKLNSLNAQPSPQDNYTPQQEFNSQLESLSQQLQIIAVENKMLKEEMGKRALNTFEKSILNCLQQGLPQKIILPHFDVGTGRNQTMFTDFIVIMNNCIVVIEAKSYKGTIKPLSQEPRNNNWICNTGNQSILINCCWGRNPYQQVNTYVNSLRQTIQARSGNQFPTLLVYGIVVFPTKAEIDFRIESNLGEYYQATTLNRLLSVIHSFETQAQSRNRTNICYPQVINIVTDKSHQNAA